MTSLIVVIDNVMMVLQTVITELSVPLLLLLLLMLIAMSTWSNKITLKKLTIAIFTMMIKIIVIIIFFTLIVLADQLQQFCKVLHTVQQIVYSKENYQE